MARDVGDMLTIVLVENTPRRRADATTASKDAGVGIAAPTMLGQSGHHQRQAVLEAERRRQAQVRRRRQQRAEQPARRQHHRDRRAVANGNLLVRGEKQIAINQGDEFVRLQGIVRPADIEPDNRIASDRVADAHDRLRRSRHAGRRQRDGLAGALLQLAVMPF